MNSPIITESFAYHSTNHVYSIEELRVKFDDITQALHRKLLNINSLIKVCTRQTKLNLLSKENIPSYKKMKKDVDLALSKSKTTILKFDSFTQEELNQIYYHLITVYKNS